MESGGAAVHIPGCGAFGRWALVSLILPSTQIAPGLGCFSLRRWVRLVAYIKVLPSGTAAFQHPLPLLWSEHSGREIRNGSGRFRLEPAKLVRNP